MKKFIWFLAVLAVIGLTLVGVNKFKNSATADDCDSVEVATDTMGVVTDTISTDSLSIGEV